MSRMWLMLFLGLLPAAAGAAKPTTAEEAVAQYEQKFPPVHRLRSPLCGEGRDPDEIIVCARRPEPREHFAPTPGARTSLLPGEPSSAAAAVNLGSCCGAQGTTVVAPLVGYLKRRLGRLFGN